MDPKTTEAPASTSTPDEATLISDAASFFSTKQYDKCSDRFKMLLELRPSDPKLLANSALLEYSTKHNYTHTEEFVSELKRIAASENTTLVPSHKVPDETHMTSCVAEAATDSDASTSYPTLIVTLKYNYALVLFYQRQYVQAERILSSCLYRQSSVASTDGALDNSAIEDQSLKLTDQLLTMEINITPVPDLLLCRRIILLWLELLLLLRQPRRVYQICGSWLTVLSSLTLINALNSTESSENDSGPVSDSLQFGTVLQDVHTPIRLFYIRSALLLGHLEVAELELNELQSDDANTEAAKSCSVPSDTLEEDTKPNVSWNTGHCMRFLHAQLDYFKGRHSDALRRLCEIPTLAQSPLETGQCEESLLWNNLALLHHRTGQFSLAGLHLRRAVRQTEKTWQDSLPQETQSPAAVCAKTETPREHNAWNQTLQIPLRAFAYSQAHALIYNLGIQLLFARKPAAAFSTLLRLVPTYPRNPRLWFRLAECCIKIHRPNNLNCWQPAAFERCKLEAVGTGAYRKLLLTCENEEVIKPPAESASMPAPTIEFASLCLRNALVLLPRLPAVAEPDSPDGHDTRTILLKWADRQAVPVLPAPAPLRGLGLLQLLAAIRVADAYIALCLSNPVQVLNMVVPLIPVLKTDSEGDSKPLEETEQSNLNDVKTSSTINLASLTPPGYQLLARLYLAEALTALDRLPEAVTVFRLGLPDAIVMEQQQLDQAYPLPSLPTMTSSSLIACLSVDCMRTTTGDADMLGANTTPDASIYPTDFPADSTQSLSLILYNLAVALSIDRQWPLAWQQLTLALPGLSLPAHLIDARRWPHNNPLPSSTILSPVLPKPVVLLQIYLDLALHRPEQALRVIREHLGHSAVIEGRLTSPLDAPTRMAHDTKASVDSDRVWSQDPVSTVNWSVPRHLPINTMYPPPSTPKLLAPQRPNNNNNNGAAYSNQMTGNSGGSSGNWFANSSVNPFTTAGGPMGGSSNRWEPPRQQLSHVVPASGLITSANESDWPPL